MGEYNDRVVSIRGGAKELLWEEDSAIMGAYRVCSDVVLSKWRSRVCSNTCDCR